MSRNIHQRIIEVMKAVDYIKKDAQISGAGGYMAVSHDQVVAQTRKHFIDAGILITPEQLRSEILIQRDVNAKVPVKMMLYSGDYAINFINVDEPGDLIAVTVNAHANDNSDKAPGKAMTYATKTAILKILNMETGVNDESRTYEPQLYRPEEKEEYDRIIAEGDHMAAVVMDQTMNREVQIALFNSFEKGSISDNKKELKRLTNKGWDVLKGTANIVISRGADEGGEPSDDVVSEVIGDMSKEEKKILTGLLEKSDIDYLTELKNA